MLRDTEQNDKDALDELNNELLKILYPKGTKDPKDFYTFPLIDFTSVSHYNLKELRTISRYRTNFDLKRYNSILSKYFEEEGFSFPDYSLTNKPIDPYKKISDNSRCQSLPKTSYDFFDSGRKNHKISSTNLNSWYELVKENYGYINCCYTYFEKKELDIQRGEFVEIGIYLLSQKDIPKNKHSLINKALSRFINVYASNFIFDQVNERHKAIQLTLRNTSLKSSLAAVMSRNMSHNIGSHVLNKLSSASEIEKFFDLKEERRFVEGILRSDCKTKFPFPNLSISSEELNRSLEPGESRKETPLEIFNKKLKENSNYLEQYKFSTFIGEKEIYTLSPYFVDVNNNTTKEELARVFNDYLKKRMDFVADVATSNKALLNSNKYLFADIFRGFERNLLLLQNISGKEDKFSYQFQFQYCDEDTTSNYYHYDDDHNLVLENGIPVKNNDFIDPIVAVPNDVLGSQAFYIILENIIRNTAKHSGSGNVVFTIKVEDLKEDDFYRITVFDNVAFSGEDGEEKAKKLKKLVVDRNISIAQEVLDEHNEIRTAGWGTIEIKLAACYLSGLDMLEMDNKLYWPIGYPRFEEEKEKIKNELKHNDNLNEVKKEYGEKWESIEKFAKEKAEEVYIEFLIDKESKQFTIQTEGLKTAVNVTDCAKDLNRIVENNKDKNLKRYPIVQAVDGSKDPTSGFGYSFLMKKPKKLLIIDEKEHLKLETKDDEGNVLIEHEDNVTALKRLGIDIEEAPKRDSIYNHQFMIIVGDENSRQYGDWFNLPQERCFFAPQSGCYNRFVYDKEKDSYLLSEFAVSPNFLNNLTQVCSNFEEKKIADYRNLYQLFSKLKHQFHNFNKKKVFSARIVEGYKDKSGKGKVLTLFRDPRESKIEFQEAVFGHHGMPKKRFKQNSYAEPYGSTSPIGLHLDSLKSYLSNLNDDSDQSKISTRQLQYLYEEGCNNSVLVLDERIQSVLSDNGFVCEAGIDKANGKEYKGYPITYKKLFKKTNIRIPNPSQINLNDTKLSLSVLLNYLKKNTKKVDYLIIHFGIIENLRSENLNELKEILNKIESNITSNYCKTIITSGRGYTPDLRALNRYFIAYSTISNLLLDQNSRSKSALIQCLKQARKL